MSTDPKDIANAKKIADAWRKWQAGGPAYKVQEVAAILDISLCSAWTAVNAGKIGHVRIGKRVIVPRPELERLLSVA